MKHTAPHTAASASQLEGLAAPPRWADGLSRRAARKPIFRALVIEDNAADLTLFRQATADIPGLRLQLARTGDEALEIMDSIASQGAEQPDLVFLDLNLPGVHGHEILKILRATWATRLVPVVVMSTSSRPADVQESYLSRANLYITKPEDVDTYMETIQKLCCFWREVVSLPKQPAGSTEPQAK